MQFHASLAPAAAIFALIGTGALAQDISLAVAPPHIPNYAGLGIGGLPDYLGSDNYMAGAAPFGRLSLGGERYVSLEGNYLSLNLLDNPNWRVGPALLYRFGRDDGTDDPVVALLPEIDDTVDAGLFAAYEIVNPGEARDRWRFGGNVLADVGSEYNGFTASVSVRRWLPVGRYGSLGISGALNYGSDNYMDTYFSVSPAGAAASGLAPYQASGGLRDIQIAAVYMHPLSDKWVVGGGALYSHLLDDAQDSPVVDDRGSADQLIFGIGVARFW